MSVRTAPPLELPALPDEVLPPLPVAPVLVRVTLTVEVFGPSVLPIACPDCGCRSYHRDEDGDPVCLHCARLLVPRAA